MKQIEELLRELVEHMEIQQKILGHIMLLLHSHDERIAELEREIK